MIHLDLDPEVEQRLLATAQARSLDPNAFAARIVTEALAIARPKHLSEPEFRTVLDGLAMYSGKIPTLPDRAYSRPSAHQDPA